MPKRMKPSYRRKAARAAKRRKTLKSSVVFRKKLNVPQAPPQVVSIVPNRAFARLIFQDGVSCYIGNGYVHGNYMYSLGNLADPRIANGGGTPSGLSYWNSFYDQWKVLRATVDVWFMRQQTSVSLSPRPCLFYLKGRASNSTDSTDTNYNDSIIESGHASFKYCPGWSGNVGSTSQDRVIHLRRKFSVRQIEGFVDHQFVGSGTSAPAAASIIDIGASMYDSNLTTSATEVTWYMAVRIAYQVSFSQLKSNWAAW